ncbi:MAG: hypothetical protein EHM46_03420 [Bacteroidetes bacterium]|nr:MAG: hypothetical protein EHM46_03420 [Bacteroidota bacterium]
MVRWGGAGYYDEGIYEFELTVRPVNTLSISLSPTFTTSMRELQYLTTEETGAGTRYIFGHIDQKVLSTSLRVNYNITPDLTIQYWGQPFIASGKYRDYKMITDPKAGEFSDRYHLFTPGQIRPEEETFQVDENMDGTVDYTFDNPDFTVDEWLSNLVVRWEILPGSTAYLVWSQTRDYHHTSGEFEMWDNLSNLYNHKKPTNTFLVKFSYRIGLR